jgi:8-oxo-dGTP diphosphatase
MQEGLKETAVLCVLHHADALLLLCRTSGALAGQYVPVGGHIEPFEAPRDAAIREVCEETGVALDRVTFHGVLVETSPTPYNWISLVYSATIERIDPPECREGILEWIEPSRLAEIRMPQTDRFIHQFVLERRPFVLDAEYDQELDLVMLREEIAGELLQVHSGSRES